MAETTFNSLYEIPKRVSTRLLQNHNFFQFSIWDSLPEGGYAEGLWVPFNSLYEILGSCWGVWEREALLSILYMRFGLQNQPVSAEQTLPFNSLYEIPNRGKITNRNSLEILSILYMRFPCSFRLQECMSESLSILYMRFRWRVFCCSILPRWSFQFSIWDSSH